MKPTEQAEKDYRIWVLLCHVRDAIYKVRDIELSESGVTVVEAGTLYVIRSIGDKATPAEISKWMVRQHHTVTALLKRMENKGLITKINDPRRKNSRIIKLTEKGEIAFQKSNIKESIQEVMSVLSEDEKEYLDNYLDRLRNKAVKYAMSMQEPILPFP